MKIRKRKEKRPVKSMTAITLLLAGTMLLCWGVSMYCLTIVTAQEFYQELYERSADFCNESQRRSFFSQWYDDPYYRDEHPDRLEHEMLESIDSARESLHTGLYLDDLRLLREESFPMETAVLFYDGKGNLLHKSGDVLYFSYLTQEEWDAGEESASRYGWVDLNEPIEDCPYAYGVLYTTYSVSHSLYDTSALRITGVMDGTQIRPAALAYVDDSMVRQALEERGPDEEGVDEYGGTYKRYHYTIRSLEQAGLLEWQTQFDRTAEAENPEELVTVYTLRPQMYVYEGSPLTYRGERYDSLLALTEELDLPSCTENNNSWQWRECSLNQIVYFGDRTYRDWASFDDEAYYAGENVPEPEIDFIMVTAIVSHPLRAAVSALRNVYIGTGILALALVLILRGRIKKRLVEPLDALVDGMADGWSLVYTGDNKPQMWRETEELYKQYNWEIDSRRCSKNEIARLNAALDYAKQAEQNRRQMTSHIAHELKTPLAIIHSYSEGLKERIAEDKREEYLDVILSEAERMDGMVLEMLDLSRLEAGKVKLSRDEFSLSNLARGVFEKLSALAEEKGLQITLELDGDCPVLADEARMEQVITNFASNAVRYTPEGGSILVKTQAGRKVAGLSVENTSPPFTSEELSKVWETFYQTDPARGGKGTGLGLAIAKSVVTLHGGKCAVRNTETGVEFSFTIPNT